MIGKLISMAGMMGMSLLCILFGHKWKRKLARNRVEHGCQVCGGTGSVPYRPDQSAVPMYRKCEACDGTGEDPNNPKPTPPEGSSRREAKQWEKKRRAEEAAKRADWLKDGRKVKVVWPNCVRCGKENPNWKNPEAMGEDDDEESIVWTIIKWLIRKLIGKTQPPEHDANRPPDARPRAEGR